MSLKHFLHAFQRGYGGMALYKIATSLVSGRMLKK